MTSADDLVLQLLVEKEMISEEELNDIRAKVAASDMELKGDTGVIEWLEEYKIISNNQILEMLANEFNMELVNLDEISVDREALEVVPLDLAQKYHVFPLEVTESDVELAICDPIDVDTTDSLSHLLNRTVTPRLASREAIDRCISLHYEVEEQSEVSAFYSELGGEEGEEGADVVVPTGPSSDAEGPIIKYVESVIIDAIRRRASDIHLEPLEKKFRVRFRVDGRLQEMEAPPKRLQPAIISRVKLMANVSIAEKRLPQDGRIAIKARGKQIDLRVSSLPTAFGESIVMRILDKEGLNLGLPQLGFLSDDQKTFEKIIAMPDGVFLVTGPTGSGKSTTLYSALNYINHPDRKIITVEDPVEYEMTGINQVQVRRDVGMTFSAALRSMLRQAPNVIMVGEIRDLETAEIAVNAALTGHMVYSTLHTNDAPGAVTRMIDIGVKPFLVSAALRAVLAQRLVRRICKSCIQPDEPDPKHIQLLGLTTEQIQEAQFSRGAGCPACNGTGYKGRFGIFEMFTVTEEIGQMIYESKTLVEVRQKARELGMRNMREDGVRKVMAGMTTFDEVLRATVNDPS